MRNFTLLCGFICLCGAALMGAAQGQENKESEPIITDRPDFTESTETVPDRMTQVEGGATITRASSEKSRTLGELLIRKALGRKLELRIGVPTHLRVVDGNGSASGFEDGSLGFKVMLSQGSQQSGLKKPRVSLIGATSLPTGSKRFRENTLQPEVTLALGWDLTERVGLASNLNYAYLSEEGERFSEFSGSLSLAYSLSERVGSYVEFFGFVPSGGRADTRFLNGGFTYLINNDFQLDARLGFGLGNPGNGSDYFWGIGAARRF
ncbi:MAG TPA: transporter [Abditibacteriaceae bacterium]|nr:transporter [Abditibacteriaceae bacterium]